MDGGSGYNQWTPENYVVEVVDCLLRQRGYDGKDDVIDAIGTNVRREFGNVSVSLLENESSEGEGEVIYCGKAREDLSSSRAGVKDPSR